jgi:hypothetical protein
MSPNAKPKVVPFYFPQFHAIPENDAWWGKGFTDWDNVRRSRPQFPGHYQPRVPAGGRYYDLADPSVLRWQVELAKAHALHGFCLYHYWFDGKLLLERPARNLLDARDLDFPFCLAWANETWSRAWTGHDRHILIHQRHVPDKDVWRRHFEYLFPFWTDPRAIAIDGRPVFLIYKPEAVLELPQMIDYWNDLAARRGSKGVFLVAIKTHEFVHRDSQRLYDAIVKFQPREVYNSPAFENKSLFASPLLQKLRLLPDGLIALLASLRYRAAKLEKIDYDDVWSHIVRAAEEDVRSGRTNVFQGAFVDWDNSPRYGPKAKVYVGASPERFEHWMSRLLSVAREGASPFVFLNAWNEWAEGAYLEPDARHGTAYLEVLRRLLTAP